MLNDWVSCKQKCNNFGYLSIQMWLKGNDTLHGLWSIEVTTIWLMFKASSIKNFKIIIFLMMLRNWLMKWIVRLGKKSSSLSKMQTPPWSPGCQTDPKTNRPWRPLMPIRCKARKAYWEQTNFFLSSYIIFFTSIMFSTTALICFETKNKTSSLFALLIFPIVLNTRFSFFQLPAMSVSLAPHKN